MWYVDSDDDAREEAEYREWMEAAEIMSQTVCGQIKEVCLIIGMHSFFNESVASTMLSLAISLPATNCNLHVSHWFMYAGLVQTLTGVFNDLITDVQAMAASDGIINKLEHYIVLFLKLGKLPLFLVEFTVYCVIVSKTITHVGNVIYMKDEAEETGQLENYCEAGPWHLMMVVSILYGFVMLFRIIVIAGDLMGVNAAKAAENKEDTAVAQ